MRRALLLLSLLVLALPAPASARVPDPVRLQALIDELVAAGAPGAGLHVRDDVGDWTGAAGLSSLGSGRAMSRSSRFRAGAVTSSYVATVTLQLVEEGRLALADTVESRLPGALSYGGRVTVGQLLAHRSGVPDHLAVTPLDEYLTGGDGGLRVWSPAELVGLVSSRPVAFEPGSAWGYSSTNYVLLGLIVEKVTGRPLGAEVERRILRPLGLEDTVFVTDPDLTGSRARGYAAPRGADGAPTAGPLVEVSTFDPSIVWASGNIAGDVEDVADFYRYLFAGRFLPPALLTEMKRGEATGNAGTRYGLGLTVTDLPCGPAFGHEGSVFGYTTIVLASEDGSRQVALFVNVSPAVPAVVDAVRRVATTIYCETTAPAPEPPAPPRAAALAAG